MSKKEKAYEVGYKKPPASRKFKKGQSGNPKGRPKGRLNFKTYLEAELNELVCITENGENKLVPKVQAAAKKYTIMAIMGDHKMLPILLNMGEEANEHPPAHEMESLLPVDRVVASSIVERIQKMLVANQNVAAQPHDERSPDSADAIELKEQS